MDFFLFTAFALIRPWDLPISTQPQEEETNGIPIIKNERYIIMEDLQKPNPDWCTHG